MNRRGEHEERRRRDKEEIGKKDRRQSGKGKGGKEESGEKQGRCRKNVSGSMPMCSYKEQIMQ